MRKRSLALLLVGTLASLCGAEESCTLGRLLLNDATSPKVAVVDLDSEASLFTFSGDGMPANAAALYATSDSMCASINYRASSIGTIKILCSGLSFENHGDHSDIVKQTPSVLPETLTGDNPTHFSVGYGQTVVFFDGTAATKTNSYAVSYLDTKFSGSAVMPIAFQTDKMGQQHGDAGPLPNNHYYVSQPNPLYLAGNSSDSLSVGFLILRKDKTIAYDLNHATDLDKRCPGFHGTAQVQSTVMFGCTSGILVLKMDTATNTVTSARVLYHDSGRRTGSFFYHSSQPVVIGQHNNNTHYAFIRVPSTMALSSASYEVARDFREFGGARPCRAGFEKASGQAFLAMFTNGSLLMFDVTDGWLFKSSIQVSEPFTCSGTFPFLVLGYNRAFVVYPTMQETREILIAGGVLKQGRIMKLPGGMRPTSGLVFGISPAVSKAVSCPAAADPADP